MRGTMWHGGSLLAALPVLGSLVISSPASCAKPTYLPALLVKALTNNILMMATMIILQNWPFIQECKLGC